MKCAKLAFILAVFGQTACAHMSSHSATAEQFGPPKSTLGELDATKLLGVIPSRAASLGASEASIVASGETVDGERLGAFVEVPADACLVAYARGSASIDDLDIATYGEDGTPIVVDEAADQHPAIIMCPPHPERIYLAVHVASGEGLVALAAHLVPRSRAESVGALLNARGGVNDGPRSTDGWTGLDDMVRKHRATLGGRWEEFRKVAVPVDVRTTSYVNFPIGADQCTDAFIVSDEGVGQIEVEAFDREGQSVARAREADKGETITVCSRGAVAASLTLRPHTGRGLAAVVLARTRGETARDLARRPDVISTAAARGMSSARNELGAQLAKAGYGGATFSAKRELKTGRRDTVAIDWTSVAANGCARADVIAGGGMTELEATAWDEDGTRWASGKGYTSATLFVCTKKSGHLDVDTVGVAGPYELIVRPETWQNAAFTQHPHAAARMLSRSATGPDSIHEGAPTAVKSFHADSETINVWEEPLAAGRCLRVAAGAEQRDHLLDLRLLDAVTREEIDRSRASDAVSARACAQSDRKVRIELLLDSGATDVVVGERVVE